MDSRSSLSSSKSAARLGLTSPRVLFPVLRSRARWAIALVLSSAPAFAIQPTITWTDNSNDEVGFQIERSIDGATFAQIATVGANITTYTDTTLPDATYWYRVRAYNSSAVSGYSNIASYQPANIVPAFTTQPVSQSALLGSNVTFTAAANGTPAPTLQWYKDGVAIAGATSGGLTLSGVTTANAGIYTVVATNSAGSATSSGAALTVTGITPAITTQPVSQSVLLGGSVSFTVAASGLPAPTYQWNKDGSAISGATASTLTLAGITSASAGTYTAIATNAYGSTSSNGATLAITGIAPAITTQPVSQSALLGSNVSFSVTANGLPSPSYQWRKDGVAIAGANSATLSLAGVGTATTGTYSVVVTNAYGSATSNGATLSVTGVAPAFSTQPLTQSATAGGSAALNVVASGLPAPSYQWFKNSVAIVGATSGTLSIASVSSNDAGTYTAVATNAYGSATSNGAVLTVTTTTPGRLGNLSARAVPGQGGPQSLAINLVVSGGAKSLLFRGVGPGLASAVTSKPMTDPSISVSTGSTVVASNDNWAGTSLLTYTFTRVGAFSLSPTSKDAALLTSLVPNTYSASIGGKANGIAMAEVYDADTATSPVGQITQMTARAPVGVGEAVLVAGFTINGNAPLHVLIRGLGPALAMKGALADPQIDLYNETGLIQHNDNWATSTTGATFIQAGASTLSAGSKDAALDVTLQPGDYTVIVSGVGNTTGVGQVEFYAIP